MSIKKTKENISKIFKIKNKKRWLPLSIMVVSIILWIGLRYTVSLSILNLEWLVVASVGMASWCWYCRLRIIACIILAWGIILAYQLFISLPFLQQSLEKAKSESPSVWVRGPIIKAILQGKDVHLHLAPAELFFKGERQRFFEIKVQLLSKSHSFNSFYHRRPIQLSGFLTGADLENQRLAISLKQVLYHTSYSPPNSWYYFGKIVHQHLRNRVAFYLPAEIFSLYSPLILARTVSRSESLQLFRATGLAHLLAISGLHIGLLYWLGLALFRLIGRCSQHILLWIHFSNFCQLLTLAGLWLYVALIAFPVPALRAVVMLTILVVIRWLGQSQAPLYALLSTAFLFLCFRSAVIYDLSFQLSFVAVLYIILILPVLKNISRDVSYWQLVIIYIWNSIWVTGSVLVGIWPILLTHFHQLSLEVFWLNIIMLPMLAFLILPVCFTALFISLFNWQALPFGIWEKTAFQGVECVLRIWLETLREVHSWGGWATIQMELHWSGWQYGLYYLTTILLLRILAQKKRRDSRKFEKASMIMLKLLVIADDLTGANEVAVQFAKKNIATLVVLDWREEWNVGSDEFQVVAVNTDSRHVSVNEAQQRMRTVLKAATSWQNPFIYKKIDSTLRGNVAAELDMMRTCLGEEKSMLIPANPSMGRTVEQGVIFVQGEPLSGSAYAGDPLEPTQESSVVRKLQCQIDAPYHLITRDILKKFHTHKQNIFQEVGCYVFDSATEQDLRRIGRLLFRENLTKVLAGSGGFAALLTEFIEFKNDSIHTLQKSKRRLLINGSLNPVVHEQIQWARSHAIPVFTLEHQRFDREESIMMDNQYLLSNWLFGAYQKSQITVLTTPSREKLNNASTSFHDKASKWNNYLGMLIASLLQVIQIEVLVIFGGDTALAILKALQLKRMEAVSEIIPGVALLKPLNGMTNPIYIVTRPGGFGEENHIGLIENFFKNGSNETSRNHDGRRQRGGS